MLTEQSRINRAFALAVGLVVSHLLFVWATAQRLASRDHYQFFPVVLIGVGVLVWFRVGDFKNKHKPKISVRVVAYGILACLLFVTANLLNSNWLGILSCILSLWTLVWFVGGSKLVNLVRGPLALLLLIVPLPMDLDLRLVLWLQQVATNCASSLLDMAGLRHGISGVAIMTEQKSFMVAEACSGVHSLFSCLSVIGVVCVLQRYGTFRCLLNIAQTIAWVLAANTLRVFLIVYSYKVWEVNLESGLPHDLLGAGTYCLALILALSTDRFFLFLVPASSLGSLAETSLDDAAPSGQAAKTLIESGDSVKKFLNKPRVKEHRSTIVMFVVVFLFFVPIAALGATGVIGGPSLHSPAVNVTFQDMLSAIRLTEHVPAKIGPWSLAAAEDTPAVADSPVYVKGGLKVRLSMNRSLSQWNDLLPMYQQQGLKLQQVTDSLPAAGKQLKTLSMYDDAGQYTTSVSACFDSKLRTLRENTSSGSPVTTLLRRLGLKSPDYQPTLPVFQLELSCSDSGQLLLEERQSMESLFHGVSEAVCQALREKSSE